MNIALNEETPEPHLLPLHCRCTGLQLLGDTDKQEGMLVLP